MMLFPLHPCPKKTNISTPIPLAKGGRPKGTPLEGKRCTELATTAVIKTVVYNFIK